MRTLLGLMHTHQHREMKMHQAMLYWHAKEPGNECTQYDLNECD